MFSLERCRSILGRECALDDDQLTRLRDQLYGLADVVTEELLIQRQIDGAEESEVGASGAAHYRKALNLLPESEREDVEERAAIIEFEAGTDRDDAERKAILCALQERRDQKDKS
jgi:hypothetical protein